MFTTDTRLTTEAHRPGAPVDPRRVVAALRRARLPLISIAVASVVAAAFLGKFVLPRKYLAESTILWEPPFAAHTESTRQIATLAQSVKLPANLLRVRDKLAPTETIESVAKTIDVTVGDTSMLITVAATESSARTAVDVANTMVDVFLDSQRTLSANRLQQVVASLQESLVQGEAALIAARAKYDTFRAAHHVADFPAEVQAAITELARVKVAADDARVEVLELEAREASLRQSQGDSPEHMVVSRNEELPGAVRMSQLEIELAAKRAKLSNDHPVVAAAAAELDALRKRGVGPSVTSQVIGRNAVRDAVSAQLEESSALRRAVEERTHALEDLRRDSEQRAGQLTAVQGEAARMLADVSANDDHVAGLFKQIAMAEDDVRAATSHFQVVSPATLPEHSQRGFRRIVALCLPFAVTFAAVFLVLWREIGRLRVRTAREAAYWSGAPVLSTTSWPNGGADEASRLARDVASATDAGCGVIGVTTASTVEDGTSGALVEELLRSAQRRGRSCAVQESTVPWPMSKLTLADWLDRRAFGDRIARWRSTHDLVLVVLPPLSERDAVRTAQRWLDGMLVVVPSNVVPGPDLMRLREEMGMGERGLGVVLISDNLSPGAPPVGDAARLWRRPGAPVTNVALPPAPQHDTSVAAARS